MDRGFTLDELPEGCISNILSLTSPLDALRSSAVSSNFRSAAVSDQVWERFLPSDIAQILSSAVPPPLPEFLSKKEFFLHLSDNPILIDNGSKSFSLERCSGKKCYMVAARELAISWGDTPMYWIWIADPQSRFPEVAELLNVCWLEICWRREAPLLLSPNTKYGAYLVFSLTEESYGLESTAYVSVNLAGVTVERKTVCLNPAQAVHPLQQQEQIPKEREDGWMEIEMGDFFNETGEDEQLEMSLKEVERLNWKSGLIIQGIELRPKKSLIIQSV